MLGRENRAFQVIDVFTDYDDALWGLGAKKSDISRNQHENWYPWVFWGAESEYGIYFYVARAIGVAMRGQGCLKFFLVGFSYC